MYSAAAVLDGFLTAGDLPDQVEVFDQSNTYTYTKNGTFYEFENQSLRPVLVNQPDARWAAFLDGSEEGDRSQPCLIAPDDTLRVTDFFSDTYNGRFIFGTTQDIGPTWTLTRTSLCVWEGLGVYGNGIPPVQMVLEYLGVPPPAIDNAAGYYLNGIGKLFGTNSSPEGTYSTEDGDINAEIF
jgi:hypothetical protein